MQYTLAEAAILLGVTLASLRKRVTRGKLPTLKIDGVHYLTEETFRQLLGNKAHTVDFEGLVAEWQAGLLVGQYTGRPVGKTYAKTAKMWLSRFTQELALSVPIALSDFNPTNLLRFYANYPPDPETQNCHYSTKQWVFNAVCSFAKYCIAKGYLPASHYSQLLTARPKRIFPAKRAKVGPNLFKLATEYLQSPNRAGTVYEREYMLAALSIGYYTGMRRGELAALKWQHVNLEKRHIAVIDGKNHKNRLVPIPKPLAVALARWQLHNPPSRSPWVLAGQHGNKATTTSLNSRMQRLSKAIGHKVTWHALRRAWTSRMLDQGASLVHVSKTLGHASTITTQQSYSVFDNEESVKHMQQFE